MQSPSRLFPSNVRKTSACVALAFCAGAPFVARAEAPQVSWNAPLSGATLSGTISGSTCSVNATSSVGMQRVIFWINQMQIQNDYSAPWNCAFDTHALPDGNYSLWVEAYSSLGERTVSTIPVAIRNSGTTSSGSTSSSSSSSSSTSTTPSLTPTSTSATPAPVAG
ncbi:MAG: hypothetical protein JO035_04205, partial [Betaproteobacteria bacterium]|nr:hypothetical protein [Betaproteobacteria bacterium]